MENSNVKQTKSATGNVACPQEEGVYTVAPFLLQRSPDTGRHSFSPKQRTGFIWSRRPPATLKTYWYKLEKVTILTTLGCFSKSTMDRLRTISRLMTLQQRREVNISSQASKSGFSRKHPYKRMRQSVTRIVFKKVGEPCR